MTNHDAMHHAHIRKRIHKNLEEYPHPNKHKRVLDRIIVWVSPIGPIMMLPQLYKIFTEQNTSGFSLVSWVTITLNAGLWLYYGIVHKEKPIIYLYIMWLIIDALIVVGIVLFG